MIAEREPKDLQIGLALLQAIKDELGLTPSRKSLDFLLNACVNAKDLQNSLLIWKEYQAAGFRYNVLTFLRLVIRFFFFPSLFYVPVFLGLDCWC